MRISENASKCVVFFGIPRPPKGEIAYGGTGFLIGYQTEGIAYPYIITAGHVARRLANESEFYLRANLKKGGSVPLPISTAEWAYHPDPNVDLAAAMFVLDKRTYDHVFFDATNAFYTKDEALCGDPVSIVGLFKLRSGNSKNVPVVHTGHIAALADPSEPIPLRNGHTGGLIEAEAYLVEAQTLDGLSGAPAFARVSIGLRLRNPDQSVGDTATVYGEVRLLGVYLGSYDGPPDATLSRERGFQEGVKVPVGMGIVVPCEKIEELMKDEGLENARQLHKHLGMSAKAATQDSGFMAPREGSENPSHKKDSTALLNVAAKKKP